MRWLSFGASALLSGFFAVIMVLAMMDLVSAGMKQGQSTNPRLVGTAAPPAAAGAADSKEAQLPGDGTAETFESRVGELERAQGETEELLQRLERGAPPPSSAAPSPQTETPPAGVSMLSRFGAWLADGVRPAAASDQWWNYLALTICQWVVLMFFMIHATVGIASLPLRIPAIAALCDWAINAPPILGVVGTIIAFAGFISSSGSSVISPELFGKAFFDAAATTVVGGLIYVVNLLLLAALARDLNAE
ncbi:MAG: hypothetical protein ACT4N2_14145 [Hyphomicrobium sp.]